MKPIELGERLGRWSSGRGPLPVLLATRLRHLIDDGELPPGELLPPDRSLAAALAVGRSTVVAAYDLLRREGKIVRRQGSGTRVAGTGAGEPAATRHPAGMPVMLHLLEPRDGVIPLAWAAPDAPPPELADAYARMLPRLAATAGDTGYYPAGHPVLRRAIAERYTRRGIRTDPERILVTSGGQQALSLLARTLLAPGDQVLVEAPTYAGALEAFREEAAVVRALPVGLAGLKAAVRQHRPALAYTIPTFHNPTGAVLPPLHRRALAETAAAGRLRQHGDLRRVAEQAGLGRAAGRLGPGAGAADRAAGPAGGRAGPWRQRAGPAGSRRPAAPARAAGPAHGRRAGGPA
jgi:DNA-binding transcriptional MocR family regulator